MAKLKKVLIITYYWPPASTAGVHRWLKFSKEMLKQGVEPIIYAPENPSYPLVDAKLIDETKELKVIKTKIFEPYGIFQKFTGKSGINSGFITENKKKKNWKEELSIWIRGNFFIPDARVFWVKPSVKFLSNYLKDNPVDFIVSSGPPHSLHLTAMQLKQKFGIPWMADFRDPWTTMDYYYKMKISKRADKIHHRQEREVITQSDVVTVVSTQMKKEFDGKYGVNSRVLYGGYSESSTEVNPDNWYEKLRIVHSGTLLKDRNPKVLWKVLAHLKAENPEAYKFIQVKLIGRVDTTAKDMIEEYGIADCIDFAGNVSHAESVYGQRNASVLLLSIDQIENSEFVLTSKIFEYIGSKRPILCIGNLTGDVADIVNQLEHSHVVDFNDFEGLKQVLFDYIAQIKNRNLNDVKGGEAFSITNRTKELIELIDSHL